MKSNIRNFLLKLNSLILALFLVFPSQIWASDALTKKDKSYNESSSIMGLQEDLDTDEDSGPIDKANASTLIKSEPTFDESADYIIEKSASLSKTTSTITYKLIFKAKNPDQENEAKNFVFANFATNTNTDQSELKVDKVNVLSESGMEEESEFSQSAPSIFDHDGNLSTIGIKTANPANGLVYYLSTKLDEDTITKIDKGDYSPIFALDMVISNSYKAPLYQNRYKLSVDFKEGESTPYLKEDEETSLVKGAYNPASTNILKTKPATITWTDYIHAKDDKEFTYKINLGDSQVADDAKIKVEFFEAMDKGYILNTKFTQDIPFSDEIKLHIPLGQIARISLTTSVKADTNTKNFTYNNQKIINPDHKKEEKTPEKTPEEEEQEEEDPLGKSSQEANNDANNATNKEAENKNSDKEDKESNAKLDQASEKENTKEAQDDTTHAETEANDKEKETSKEETKEEAQSAIGLNKEAYLQKSDDETLAEAVNQIEKALEAYNKEESTLEDLKANLANIANDHNLKADKTEEIIGALLIGLNEEKYKVATINPALLTEDFKEAEKVDKAKLSDDEIKDLIKEEFAKKNSGQITEEDLEQKLGQIREENNLDKEAFFNLLADLYKNNAIETKNLEEETPTLDTEKSKEEALREKLAEENLTTEDFIAFLQSYAKAYELTEDDLQAILANNQDEVEKVIGDFTIDEIVAAAYLAGLNPHIFAGTNEAILDADFSKEKFITELEYSAETLTRSTNEDKFFEIVKDNFNSTSGLSDQQIRNDYVGWKINIPGTDDSDNDITEFKKDKYEYDKLNFSIYAPAGQSLEDYKVVVEDGGGGTTSYSDSMTQEVGDHYVYSFSIPKDQLSDKGYYIYVVAKAPKKRQNYAIGLKVSPDKNYVTELAENYKDKFEELKKRYPLLIKWMDTSDANPYRNGINLIDTRMVYLEPNGWQDLFPYNGFKSIDYNDNITDTDLMKNRVSMFGNIDKNGQIRWTISETFPAEKLENKNTVGRDAYSAKSNRTSLGNPSVQVLVPDGAGYKVAYTGDNVDIATLQSKIGNQPGTIVNYTFKEQAKDKDELTTLSLDSGKSASIAHKPVLERKPKDVVDQTGLKYLHKVQEHNNGSGYEIALSNDQAHTMKAFIPKDTSANPRYKDSNFVDTGVIVFCLNPGKPEPTRQYKFNGTITKGEWSTKKEDWAKNGRALAALATANEAKASPLYNGTADDKFYASLYEHILRLYWYGQELAEEYQLDEQSYYKIIQYNLYYWLAGENYAENFRNGGGYNTGYFSSAEYSYAQGLKQRIKEGKDWDKEKVDYDNDIQFFYYGHDKTRSYQNTITGDTKRKAKKGSVTVNKVDSQSNEKLPGAYFQLLDKNKDPIKTLVTDQNGVAIFDDLNYGTYYIKEVQGPKGYQFTDQLSKVEVNEEKAHVTFNHTNTINEIEFRKVNESGRAMSDVVFELRRNGRALEDQDQTSGNKGKFGWKELTPGYYEVVEKKVDNPLYSENEGRTVASFRVDENNKIQDKVIYYPNDNNPDEIVNKKNEGKPIGIEFTKIDATTGNPLEGAEFVLEYKKTGSSIFSELPGSRRRSTSDGKLVWNDLVDGDYRVIETKAPEGNYDTELNLGEKATFTIVRNKNNYYEIESVTPSSKTITNTEKPEEPKIKTGEFEFTKVDSETKEKLQEVEFTLTSDAPVGPEKDKFDYKVSKTTGEDGKITYSKLYPGTYTLKETKQLPGYQENTKTWKVVVDSQGETKVQSGDSGGYKVEFAKNPTTFRNKGNDNNPNYILKLNETSDPKKVNLDVSVKPKTLTGQKVGIYYIYDGNNDEKIKDLVNDPDIGSKIAIKSGYEVTDQETYKKHLNTIFYRIWNDEGYKVIVSLIDGNYEEAIYDSSTRNQMQTDISNIYSTRTALFAYYGYQSDILKSYVYNKYSFYKDGVTDPDFKELKEFIGSNAAFSTDKDITINFNQDVNLTFDRGISSEKINVFYENGKYLIPGKDAKVTIPIQINDLASIAKNNNGIKTVTGYSVTALEGGGNITSLDGPIIKVVEQGEDSGPLTITNDKEKPKLAKLTIRKYDKDTNLGLEGAEFELYDNASATGKPIDKAISNEHGYAVFTSKNIKLDTTYYVKEVKAPEGYKFTSAITEVKSSAQSDNTINAEIPNEKNNARFELYKKGSDGEYLEGVKFNLTNKTKGGTVELTTDANGYLSYDELKTGTSYELKEVKSAQGYTLNNAKATISVDASGKVTVNENDLAIAKEGEELGLVLVATNIKQPSIDFVKQDGTSNEPLEGAEFVLEKDGKEVTNSLTSSGSDGKFGFDNLEDGSYTVYETAPPEGYPYLGQIVVATFTVKDGKVTNLETNQKYDKETIDNFDLNEAYPIYNKVNEIKFTKIGKDKKALAGAKFKLDRVWDSYDENGKIQSHRDTVLKDIETQDDGIIALSATEPGRYQLIETQAPEGYQISKTGQIVAEFTVERGSLAIKNVLVGDKYIQDMTGNTETLEIVNKEEGKGKFQVNKVKKDGNTTKPLTGARFLLIDMESGQYVNTDGTLTTNSGKALTDGSTVNYENLPVGEYELREFKSPDGYVRTINTWKIVVEKDGKTTISEKEKLDNDVDAEITEESSGLQASLKLVNKSNEIEFTKIDSKTKKPLVGVEFEIWWDQQGDIDNRYEDTEDTEESQYKNYVKIESSPGSTTFTTNENGKFKLSNLKTGHYKIYETQMLEGYYIEEKPTDNEPIEKATGEFVNEFYVDIDGDIKKNDNGIVGGDDDVLVTTIKNTPITGKFRVQKVGEDGVEKLNGAEFKLYKVADGVADKDKPIKSEDVKDSEERAIIGLVEFNDLENGDYLLEETKAPKGYVISNTQWNINVNDGKVNISSTNGSVDLSRTDDTITINVVNKKPTMPQTGGAGTKIAFTIIGTAVMLAGIAYFGIFANDKNRRRSSRYNK